MTFSQQHDLISANIDVFRHKEIGSKIGAIRKEGTTELKQIYIYLAITIPYIHDKEEPYAFTHNWTYFHTQYINIYVQYDCSIFINLLWNLKLFIKDIYQKKIKDSPTVADIWNINERDQQLSSQINILLGSDKFNINRGIVFQRYIIIPFHKLNIGNTS